MKPKKQIVLPRNITKLDLGDTNHGEGQPLGKNWTSISLEGDDIRCEGDSLKGFEYKLKGDYSNMPYRNNSFSYAYGGCFLEFETAYSDKAILNQFKEVFRVLKKGGVLVVSGCMTAESDKDIRELESLLQHYATLAIKAGFTTEKKKWKLVHISYKYPNYNYNYTSVPEIRLKKK